MMIKAVNHENLYIDEEFSTVEELKNMIHRKYGIPMHVQHIVFNGRFYVLGLFDRLESMESAVCRDNPFAEFGCPDGVFDALASSGVDMDTMKDLLFPHREDADEEKDMGLKAVDASSIAEGISSCEIEDVGDVSEGLSDEQKHPILRHTKDYINMMLKRFICGD